MLDGVSSYNSSLTKRVMAIVVAALATRIITFGNPILYTDEEFYFAAGRALTNGALPFVDIWDRKPIGLFLLYAVPAAFPFELGVWLYQGMALACVVVTALVIARLADLAGWSRGGTLAGIAYLAWITIAGGQGGQAPVFYNVLTAFAVLLIAHQGRFVRWHGLLAMFLVGLAIQVKYTAAFEGIYFGLWLMLMEWKRSRSIGSVVLWGAVLAGLALVPTIAAIGYYASIDALPAFVFANFESIFGRNADPSAVEFANIAKACAILLPMVAMAFGAPKSSSVAYHEPRTFMVWWLVIALIGFALLPPWTDHYTLSVMLPGAVVAAGFLSRQRGRTWGGWLILTAVLIGQISLVIDRKRRGTPAQFAMLTKAVGRGPGCLYVYSGSSMLYPSTGRCAVSPYVFPSHLTREREAGAIGVDQMTELRRVFAKAPAVIVMGPLYQGERSDIRSVALGLVAKDYRLAGRTLLGRKQMMIFRRRIETPPSGFTVRFALPADIQ